MHFMNRQRGRHMSGGQEQGGGNQAKKPQITIHSHSAGHTVHIMHPDGQHEQHEHEDGDSHGIAEHIHEHLGNGGADGHGEQRPEEELGSAADRNTGLAG